MNEHSHLSIGEVLSLLRQEFPDITISKIRFLESRGLLVPERTPSGYRKFYDRDVDRLRWILRQQRENFLPLKVIKGRLEGQEPSSEPTQLFEVAGSEDAVPLEPVFAAQPANGSRGRVDEGATHASTTVRERSTPMPALAGVSPAARASAGAASVAARPPLEQVTDPSGPSHGAEGLARADTDPPAEQARSSRTVLSSPAAGGAVPAQRAPQAGVTAVESSHGMVSPPPPKDHPEADLPESAGTRPGAAVAHEGTAGAVTLGASTPAAAGVGSDRTTAAPRAEVPSARPDPELAGASLTASELSQASGLDVRQIEELESYGLIESRTVAGVSCFDEEALIVAGLAAGFARFGVEARHLRMFKMAAERQASMYSQIVMPLLRQRNPDARRRAHEDLTRLTELGASMQACFAKAVLRDLTRG